MTRVLIISYDVVGTKMAGPGIRYWELARALASRLDVTLATPGESLTGEGFACHVYALGDWHTLAPAVAGADVLLLPGDLLLVFPQLETCGKPLVMDAISPYTFEALHLFATGSRDEQTTSFTAHLKITQQLALAGDFFFCANERQRDYWLGVLDAVGRINPNTYATDQTLRTLIDCVPFGLPSYSSTPAEPVMKGVLPGIAPTDRVVLWGGGLWQWLDPLSLVQAIARVTEERPDVRLVFPGTRRPNPIVPSMPMLDKTTALSEQLGLTDRVVFFGEWVPYELWPAYLLEADIGASMHFDIVETRFAHRTRVLDYVWAGLPMVVTGGDETSDMVTRHDLGEVVSPGDVVAIASAIERLLDTPNLRQAYAWRFEQARSALTWEKACEPIVRFCENPRFAPDRALGQPSHQTRALKGVPEQVDELQVEEQQQAEIDRLRGLVRGYEQGRFIRATRWLHKQRRRLAGGPP